MKNIINYICLNSLFLSFLCACDTPRILPEESCPLGTVRSEQSQLCVEIDECAGQPCQNGASCKDWINSFICTCPDGFSGHLCEVNFDECENNPCLHGSSCLDGVNDYTCECTAGFTGKNCEVNIDECANNPCFNGSSCLDGINSYTCECTSGYTGAQCETNIDDCIDNPCLHDGLCLDGINSYQCECLAGYTGVHCEINIDECANAPCLNGATCTDEINAYSCVCIAGYEGRNCEINIDDCADDPCLNGGTCIDGIQAYSCACLAGYMGTNCEINIDDCADDPCLNGGTCIDEVNAYTCTCPIGFTGLNCEINIDDCAHTPCLNGGSCIDGTNAYACFCSIGYTGTHCEINIDDCADDPCLNGGICTDGVATYTCDCATGYTGEKCEINIDDCVDEPCLNGGSCTDEVNAYRCDCASGYSGTHCEIDIDDCANAPCLNEGLCTDKVNAYTCDCAVGYEGTNCEVNIDDCADAPCLNGGSCTDGVNAYTCDCVMGYEGRNCETNIDDCAHAPCLNGGLCTDKVNAYTCDCVVGYEGTNCESNIDDCADTPCLNGGSCTDKVNAYTCDCAVGYEGTNCESNIDDCADAPCLNGGLCTDGINAYTCACALGFSGVNCEINIDDCADTPCLNGGSCTDGINAYTCDCAVGYEGTNCEVNIDDCANAPCLNGGSCTDGINAYTCDCAVGYEGTNCEVNIDDCANNPCLNGGSCTDGINAYTCACAIGFSGANCEINIDDCVDQPCLHGSCIDGVNAYTCDCTAGYTGTNCETNIDDCANNPCLNGGSCTDGINAYTCSCIEGYEGTNCETNIDDCANNPCLNGGSCTDGINAYTCSCVTGYTGAHCELDIDECETEQDGCEQLCENSVGAFACSCLAGYELLANGLNCQACPTGSVSEAGEQCQPCPEGSYDDGTEQCVACPDGFSSEQGSTGCFVSTQKQLFTSSKDYGYLFWPENHKYQSVFSNIHYVQTGYYALAIDVSSANISHLGMLSGTEGAENALLSPNTMITDRPSATVQYSVTEGATIHVADGFYSEDGTLINPSRLEDMGRFMQRLDIPQVTYENSTSLEGRVVLAAMPRHFVLTHQAQSSTGGQTLAVSLTLSGTALSDYPLTQILLDGRALQISNAQGEGWTLIISEDVLNASATRSLDGSATFTVSHPNPTINTMVSLSVIAVPSNVGGADQLNVWLNPSQTAGVRYAQLNRDGTGGSALTQAQWDPQRGLYVVKLSGLGGANWFDLSIHNRYNRHRIIIDNNTSSNISVPVAFDGGGTAAYYITGGSPLLRDTQGEPLGVPVQISKNWHDPPAWYHLYSTLEVEPGSYEFEHTFAHSKWGEAYASAHAQLSLIGWGENQQWDESSLGAFGESITYDPDLTLNRAMVDDVRPFLVNAGTQWSWTGNVGGASFLVYDPTGNTSRPDHELGRLRTHYKYTGPNLTNVIYAGITRDQKISAHISTQLGRTDDLVRAYYHLRYTFHQDVTYERLALFQIASDRYADNGFTRYAYGNADHVLFDEVIPNHQTTNYAAPEDRGIPLDGPAPWVMLYQSVHTTGNLPEHLANVAFVIRDYRAQIGEELITTPHININRTYNGGWSQMAFELGIPYHSDPSLRTIPAGSVIEATVEYLIPPSDKDKYYGQSDYLTALPSTHFQNTQMGLTLARDNQLKVTPYVGSLLRTYPIEFMAAPGATAVRFILNGGLGYTPLTIHGLARPDGWRLERLEQDSWVRVDQSVEGNDYWQAYEDPASGSYDLIFNLHNRGTYQYRLTRGELPCVGVLTEDARVCDDVNECASNQGGCAQNCQNTEGSFECSCDLGYVLNADGFSCDDIDECLSENGGCAQLCQNEQGSAPTCACQEGFVLNSDGVSCDDIDECLDPSLNTCSTEEPCSNTVGSYVCGCTPPTCQPEGCTDPQAPNYVPEALLDDGSCFSCAEGTSLTSRFTACDWACEEDWGSCWVEDQGDHCLFYYCESAHSCESNLANEVDDYSQERSLISSLSNLTLPRLLVDDVSDTLFSPTSGQTQAFYFDGLEYQGHPTRVYAYLGLPADASSETPVPGIVLVHGGGGTAFQTWVERWVERGYAALAIAVEGQTDILATQEEIDAGLAVGSWLKHHQAGPARLGAYQDAQLNLEDQWIYHASADTILAHSILASLSEVRTDQIGVMGISWGGVIVSTIMGLDDRLAFAIPTYGNGHKYDIPNYFGTALTSNTLYREVWDPMNWIAESQTPTLWLTWLEENNFSHDSQAATYHQANGVRMISIVPDMGHGHALAWNRPESYDFADSVCSGAPWANQSTVQLNAGIAEAKFTSSRPLLSAELIYSTDHGWTGDFTWNTVLANLVEDPAGTWTATAPLPPEATGWFFNAYALSSDTNNTFSYSDSEVVLSSEYQENIEVILSPQPSFDFGHPLAADRTTAQVSVGFTAPSYVEIVDILVHSESHPGSFCSPRTVPWSLTQPLPNQHKLDVTFDNTIAGLQEGEIATAVLSVLWSRLDGYIEEVSLPIQVTARTAFNIVYDVTAPWSSQTVYAADQVTITQGAVVHLDLDQTAAQLHLTEGTLKMDAGQRLEVTSQLSLGAQGSLEISNGEFVHGAMSLTNHGFILIDGGVLSSTMSGYSRGISGSGLIELNSGSIAFTGGIPQNILDLNTYVRIKGGVAQLSGQVRIGLNAPSTFEIVGDDAQVSMVRLNMSGFINKGTLRFVLDETGVSGITIPGWMDLKAAKLEVDGSSYQGSTATFILIDSTNFVGQIPAENITISGFDPSFNVSVVQSDTDDWVQLVIEGDPL